MADSGNSIWQYSPNFPLAMVATILYGLIFLVVTYQTVFRYRAWFFLCVVVGALIEVIGYALRSYSTQNQTELPPYVVSLVLVVLAPVFIAAGNYLLIGRLIRAVLPPTHHKIFGVPARFLTPFFVTCDVLAFLVQGGGSGLASSDNWTGPNKDAGEKVLIAGLAFQFVAFSAYLCIFVRFHTLGRVMEVETAPGGWRNVVRAVYVSSSLIMVRCIYRIAEFAEGIDGYAFKHEWLFWVFEALPMLFAIGIFCLWHPGRYLGKRVVRRKGQEA